MKLRSNGNLLLPIVGLALASLGVVACSQQTAGLLEEQTAALSGSADSSGVAITPNVADTQFRFALNADGSSNPNTSRP